MLFLAHELQGQSVALTLALQRGLPRVLADRTQLQQVVVNLAVDAIQAMAQTPADARQLTVRTQVEDGVVRLDFEDSGPGIDPEQQVRLFESFFTTKSNGMGMGLPICRSIVETYGGAISVRNREQGGACFTVILPATA